MLPHIKDSLPAKRPAAPVLALVTVLSQSCPTVSQNRCIDPQSLSPPSSCDQCVVRRERSRHQPECLEPLQRIETTAEKYQYPALSTDDNEDHNEKAALQHSDGQELSKADVSTSGVPITPRPPDNVDCAALNHAAPDGECLRCMLRDLVVRRTLSSDVGIVTEFPLRMAPGAPLANSAARSSRMSSCSMHTSSP